MGNTKLGQRFQGLPQLTCFLIDVVHAMRVAAHQHFCGRDTIHHSLFQWIDDGTVKTLCDCHYHERLVDEPYGCIKSSKIEVKKTCGSPWNMV